MLSDNKGVTKRVKRTLFRRIGDRTLFDYFARPLEKAIGVEIAENQFRLMKRFVWLFNVYAVDVSKDPERFDAVLATQLLPPTEGKSRYGFVLMSIARSQVSLCYEDWRCEEITILQPSFQEEEQMWAFLHRLTDGALVRVANYNYLLAVSSREVSAGDADLRMRRASTD